MAPREPTPAEAVVAALIERKGPVGFDTVVEVALYHERYGFYTGGGAAGRRGDFLTSVEVGPLFGAVVAGHLDRRWRELGEPDPFVVVECGAGVGTLAVAVRAAAPACAGALTYVLVERSAALRARHGDHLPLIEPATALPPVDTDDGRALLPGDGPRFTSTAAMPRPGGAAMVLANELLDNLPFSVARRSEHGWDEVRVGLVDAALGEVLVPAPDAVAAVLDQLAPEAPAGARVPWQPAAAAWLREALAVAGGGGGGGPVVVFDYAADTAELADRPVDQWLRTYRGHERGGPPLADLGRQDITCEVAVDQLARVARPRRERQDRWLREQGIDALVDEGRRIWHERATIGDLAAVRGRSRVREAEALLAPDGLGAFTVLEWPPPHPGFG